MNAAANNARPAPSPTPSPTPSASAAVGSPTVDRVMADARAAEFATRSIKRDAKRRGLELALSMLDLTTLEGKDSPDKVRSLCRKAVTPDPAAPDFPHVAAVCVYPELVGVAVTELDKAGRLAWNHPSGEGVHVASVATGFPSGQYPIEVRLEDTKRAIRAGADEIDMVISRGAFLAGDRKRVAREIEQVKAVCTDTVVGGGRTAPAGAPHGAHLKVILETGELETYDLVREASDLAIHAGADFIKTSTGKVAPAATMGVTLVMLEAVRDHFDRTGAMIGVKPAGGIRTAKQALHYLVMVKETLGDAWLDASMFRFGASSLANDILSQLARLRTGAYMSPNDFTDA